jgi:ribonuclease HI
VKAHIGIQGNETADRLAKKAAMEDTGEIVYD